MVPKAEDLPTLRLKHTSSEGIVGLCVLRSVQFDDEFFLNTAEVCNVGWDWMLAAELEAIQLARPEKSPQLALRVCHFPARTT
jgi:hypothetical protein